MHNLLKCFRIILSNHRGLHTGTFRWIGLTAVFIFRKSTFFNVLTKSQAAAENFPFCTIDPNESRVPIPDERYDFLCQFHKPARYGVSSFTYYSHFRSVVSDGLLAIGMRKHMTMLLTCSCQFLYDVWLLPCSKEKAKASEAPTSGYHTHLLSRLNSDLLCYTAKLLQRHIYFFFDWQELVCWIA